MKSIVVVGIDVAKEKLDVAIFNGLRFVLRVYENSKKGIERLIKDAEEENSKLNSVTPEIKKINPEPKKKSLKRPQKENKKKGVEEKQVKEKEPTKDNIHFVMEATGSYHMKSATFLTLNGYENVYVLNPLIIKRYGDESLKRVKTDKEASKLLAEYGYTGLINISSNPLSSHSSTLLSSRFKPLSKDTSKLKLMVKTLSSLYVTRTRILNEIEALEQYPEEHGIESINSLRKVLEEIDREIKDLEKKIKDIMNKEDYRDTYRRLKTIPGIGERTASALIACLDSFDRFETSKQVVSYIGLTPSIKESGKSVKREGYTISRMGNPYLRQLLFMGSLSASQYNNQCRILYERLLKEGKNKKLILIAVAHKLLRQAFAITKYGREYDSLYGIKTDTSSLNIQETLKNYQGKYDNSLTTIGY